MRAFTDTRLAATHFRVLGVISRMDGFGHNGSGCYATQQTLAKRAGCDRSTVNRVMRDLRTWGYIQAVKQPNSKRPQHFVVHQTVEHVPVENPVDNSGAGQKVCSIGHTSSDEGVTNRSHFEGPERDELVTQIDSSKQCLIDSPESGLEIDSPKGGTKSQKPRFSTPDFPNRPESVSEDQVVESEFWAYRARAKRAIKAGYIPTAAQVQEIQYLTEFVCDADTGDRGLECAFETLCFDVEEVAEVRSVQWP